ncbi:MAG: 23S rRNA (adenine(2503)-C(2))-methyltransferase RlmN [Holophagaceae bacterium]|nr:23S rRNA (adenine(2503)-C(2))-methyltransferase RlmN [Holophagaceae bacterium]
MDRKELRAWLAVLGEPAFRGDQVFEGLHRHRFASWNQFTSLSTALRAKLESAAQLQWPEITESIDSEDGSTKHVFRLSDGRQVEGVHMPLAKRRTLCLSSQVGCAMGCTFCATGLMGIVRNLSAGEIVGQVVAMLTAHHHSGDEPVNLVFMGMGEPLHNLENVMKAFRILTDAGGLGLSPRRITVSTSGLASGIERMAAYAKRPRLALSLNATTDEYRSRIMPVNRAWNLAALAEVLARFPLEKRERITLEYVLLSGVTDSLEDGRRLARFAQGFPSKINLIPFNPHEGSGFEPPSEERIGQLCQILSKAGLTVSVRRSRGQDVAGACGQLIRKRGDS